MSIGGISEFQRLNGSEVCIPQTRVLPFPCFRVGSSCPLAFSIPSFNSTEHGAMVRIRSSAIFWLIILAPLASLVLTWYNTSILKLCSNSLPQSVRYESHQSRDSSLASAKPSKISHEIGWWTPYVEGTATTFHPPMGPKYAWCQLNNRTESNSQLPAEGVVPKGLLYIKSPKTSSSTCAGINIGLSKHIARRLSASEGNISGEESKKFSVQCEHYEQHEFANRNLYLTRNRNESIMWTFVRNPRSKDISKVFFTAVSLKGVDPNNSAALIRSVEDQRHRQTMYINAGPVKKSKLAALLYNPKRAAAYIRKYILEKYDFIGVVERRLESLAVMTLLWDLDPTEVIVLGAKQAGESYIPGHQQQCIKLVKASNLHPTVKQYLNSSEYKDPHADFLLYYAADLSLDRTIEALGSERVAERMYEIGQLQQLAEEKCQDKAIFPCTNEGIRNGGKTNCYFSDFGCGHQCVDEVMADYRQGKMLLSP